MTPDDFEVEGRAVKLLRLAAGAQARARHESWKKRQVQIPRDEKPEAVTTKKAGSAAEPTAAASDAAEKDRL